MGGSQSKMHPFCDLDGRLDEKMLPYNMTFPSLRDHRHGCDMIVHSQFAEEEDSKLPDDSPNPMALNAMLSFASFAASLAGPAGAFLGAALSIFPFIFSGPPQPDFLPKLIDAFKTVQENEKMHQQISAIRAYCEWVAISQPILDNMDNSNEHSMQELLEKINATWTDELHPLYLSALVDPAQVTWSKRSTCTLAVAAVTCLISAHSIKCRILAWLALTAHATNNASDARKYRTSFTNAYNTMLSTCAAKKQSIEALLSAAIKDRVAAIEGPTWGDHMYFSPTLWKGNNPDPVPAYLWRPRDMYQGQGSFWQWYIEDTTTSRFIGWYMREVTFFNLPLNQPKMPDRASAVKSIVEENCRRFCKCTEWRIPSVMEKWDDSMKFVANYIKPHMPDKFVPSQSRLEDVKDPHPWLSDAKSVSWAYALSTEDGASTMSLWTPEYEMPARDSDGSVKLPVLQLDDFNFKIKAQRMVYHRKIVKDTNAQVGYTSEPVLARVLDGNAFVDRMPDL